MEINEYVPSIASIKRFVDWEVFSEEQKWIVYLIAEEKLTWANIRRRWNTVRPQKLYDSANESCLERSALSRTWHQGKNIGNQTFLCKTDTDALNQEIVERARIATALNTISVRDEAMKHKTERYISAAKFLREIKCDKLAAKLEDEDIIQPSRTWINGIIEKIDASLQYPTLVDGKRFLACSNVVIDEFFLIYLEKSLEKLTIY